MDTLMDQMDRALQELYDLKFCNALAAGATLDGARDAGDASIELPELDEDA